MKNVVSVLKGGVKSTKGYEVVVIDRVFDFYLEVFETDSLLEFLEDILEKNFGKDYKDAVKYDSRHEMLRNALGPRRLKRVLEASLTNTGIEPDPVIDLEYLLDDHQLADSFRNNTLKMYGDKKPWARNLGWTDEQFEAVLDLYSPWSINKAFDHLSIGDEYQPSKKFSFTLNKGIATDFYKRQLERALFGLKTLEEENFRALFEQGEDRIRNPSLMRDLQRFEDRLGTKTARKKVVKVIKWYYDQLGQTFDALKGQEPTPELDVNQLRELPHLIKLMDSATFEHYRPHFIKWIREVLVYQFDLKDRLLAEKLKLAKTKNEFIDVLLAKRYITFPNIVAITPEDPGSTPVRYLRNYCNQKGVELHTSDKGVELHTSDALGYTTRLAEAKLAEDSHARRSVSMFLVPDYIKKSLDQRKRRIQDSGGEYDAFTVLSSILKEETRLGSDLDLEERKLKERLEQIDAIKGVLKNVTDQKADSAMSQPLDLLVVSNDEAYTNMAKEYFKRCVAEGGQSLFNITLVTKEELFNSIMPTNGMSCRPVDPVKTYKGDIVFFDFRDEKRRTLGDDYQLPLLDAFLARNKNCYAIATTIEDQSAILQKDFEWKNLRRLVDQTQNITKLYRFGKNKFGDDYWRKAAKEDELRSYFDLVFHSDLLDPTMINIVRELKEGDLHKVVRQIVSLPKGFPEFSESIREQYGSSSDLVHYSLDKSSEFNPDSTHALLNELIPFTAGEDSVPQHCYPPFEDLETLTEDVITPYKEVIRDQALAIYIHIPFCPRRCQFCDYDVIIGATKKDIDAYLEALDKEMKLYRKLISDNDSELRLLKPTGIHIGGGTPTLLNEDQIKRLGDIIKENFDLSDNPQLTFEASPGTVTEKKLDAYQEMGTTRASIGIQSFCDETLLRWLNRWFSTDKGRTAIGWMQERWGENTNVDLMYGLPAQRIDKWEQDLDAAIVLNVPSITVYEFRRSSRNGIPPGQKYHSEHLTMLMRVMATKKLLDNGYTQNSDNHFVKSTAEQPYVYKEAKKRGGSMLGFGLSSYSILHTPEQSVTYFNTVGDETKKTDPSNIYKYSEMVEGGVLPIAKGEEMHLVIDAEKRRAMHLFITQGLKLSGVRTAPNGQESIEYKVANGIDTAEFERRFGESIQNAFPNTQTLMDKGLLQMKDGYLGLTYKGLSFEDKTIKTFWR